VVGLGNPGPRYRGTRHNVGFDWVDAVSAHLGARWKNQRRFQSEMAEWPVADRMVPAMKPQTFMNHSGQAVAAYTRANGLAIEQTLVVHDDLDLPPGTVRLKAGGGHGGHNGLRSLIDELGRKDFLRLRIGVGHPGDRQQVVPYVLSRPSPEERRALEAGMERAREVLPQLAAGQWQRAVNQLHSAA